MPSGAKRTPLYSLAPGGNELRARDVHRRFLDAFGLDEAQVPLLQMDLTSSSTPFTAVPARRLPPRTLVPRDADPFSLTGAKCDAMVLNPRRSRSKFWEMWGSASEAWTRVPPGGAACWGRGAEAARAFFRKVRCHGAVLRCEERHVRESVRYSAVECVAAACLAAHNCRCAQALSGDQCDANWFEGASGALGRRGTPPGFTVAAPALLGFDDTIFKECSARLGKQEWYNGPGSGFNDELVHRRKGRGTSEHDSSHVHVHGWK